MRPEGIPIQTLLLRTFLPAVVLVALLLAALVYNWVYATIIDGFDRKLVTTSALTGALIDPEAHDRLMRQARAGGDAAVIERGQDYLRNVEPMRRVRESLGLTYLYSQALGKKPREVVYVLDSSQGDDHSAIGATDELPEKTILGLKRTQTDGSIYISPIEYQEQWGLLKTAGAPVYGRDGRFAATAGADVNISVIQVATQNVLFASALIGIGSILSCVLVAWVVVQRVARPIVALKQEALYIAAGNAPLSATISGPREVARLREALAALARQMSAASLRSREAAAHHEREADRTMLACETRPLGSSCAQGTGELALALPGERAEPGAVIGEGTVRNLLALRRIAPFDTLTETELLLVASQVHFRRFSAGTVLLGAGSVAASLFVVIEGEVLAAEAPAAPVFDASSALFGLPARGDYRAGPEGAGVLCLAKPHLFTIARECPDFIVGLSHTSAGERA
jgi:hypothetical protein